MNQTPMAQQPMMGNPRPVVSKWLWITLIIVVLAGAGYFSWYYFMGPGKKVATTTTTTPTVVDETAGWQTYTNTTYTFSFKYPKDWTAKEVTSTSALLDVNLSKGTTAQEGTDNPGVASVSVYESLSKLDTQTLNPTSLKDYLDKYAALTDPVYLTVATQKIGSLSGYSAKMGPNQFGGGSIYFAVMPNNKIISIRTYSTGATQSDITNMLGSFKFTTATATTSTTSATDTAALAKLCQSSNPGLTCAVGTVSGNYATGTASDTSEGSHWYAKKVSDTWTMVQNGLQDDPSCTKTSDFPKTIVPTCAQ